MRLSHGLLILCLAFGAGVAQARPAGADYVARLRAQALLESLNADLLSHDSATATLQRWCDDRDLAPGQAIVAHRVRGADRAPDEAVLAALRPEPGERVLYRRVELACGPYVLSRADNWYRPARLTPAMNAQLETTETPFGVVVRDLRFTRRTLAVTVFYHPLGDGWRRVRRPATQIVGDSTIPDVVLQHRAVLADNAGIPFSVVVENYTAATTTEMQRQHR
jgi:hypothetical protein